MFQLNVRENNINYYCMILTETIFYFVGSITVKKVSTPEHDILCPLFDGVITLQGLHGALS